MTTAMAAPSLSLFISSLFLTKPPSTSPPPPPQLLHLPWRTPLVSTTPPSFPRPKIPSHSADISSILYPSLSNAKPPCFKSGFNTQIKVNDDEPEESILIRFRRAVMKAGILRECKRRRSFESAQDKKKRKARDAARRRNRMRRPRPRVQPKPNRPKKEKKDKDEDDNWELPEGDIPYC